MVEHDLAKVGVASPSLVFRSSKNSKPCGLEFLFVVGQTIVGRKFFKTVAKNVADPYICTPKVLNTQAEVAQLVEHDLAKVGVASPSLVFRSKKIPNRFWFGIFCLQPVYRVCKGCPGGGIGRRAGLKILYAAMRVRVQFPSGAHSLKPALVAGFAF